MNTMLSTANLPLIIGSFVYLAWGLAAAADAPPVYKDPPRPEDNPWQAAGIPANYTFGACYTRKNHDEAWNARSRTDEYSDVMVKFDNTSDELVFGRRTSYRPVWIAADGEFPFPRLHPHVGDGPDDRPDAINRFARAQIIHSNDDSVIIHWRYLPAPPQDIENPDPTAFIDEYFLITPDHRVLRTMRRGAPKLDDWLNDLTVVGYTLGPRGIEEAVHQDLAAAIKQAIATPPAAHKESASAQIRELPADIPAPRAAWRFDEGRGDTTKEVASDTACEVAGHKTYWRTGVSGSCLGFDGWYSRITAPPKATKHAEGPLTIDAWAAIGAYPWNYCPIIQQGDVIDQGGGWFFGISPEGYPTLAAMIDGKKHILEAEHRIELREWAHLTGVIDTVNGVMSLYINGTEAASRATPPGEIEYTSDDAQAPIVIGQGPPLHTAWPVRESFPYPYSFDGLVDEIRLFDQSLSTESILAIHGALDPGEGTRRNPDLEERTLPSADPEWNTFSARFTHLKFHDMWDNMYRMGSHPDIVVTFDKNPTQYVLWHGANYVPMLVSENGRWYSNEFNETWWRGCCEPMSDKKVMFGQVHIIEQSAARIVLKWRYPLCNVLYGIYGENESPDSWGEWAEWIFHIYPDGSIVKKMRVYAAEEHRHEWHESMAIMGPGQHPESVIDKHNTLELVTNDGTVRKFNWITAPPTDVNYEDAIVHKVNLFAKYDPYTITEIDRGNVYNGERTPYAVFPSWDHWPVSQLRSDGRKSHFSDRASHSSLTHIYWNNSIAYGQQGTFEEKVLVEGMTNKPALDLLPLARFSLNPPEAQPESEGFSARFDPNQKAYILTRKSGDVTKLRFNVPASNAQPLVNPALVVENWGHGQLATVKLDGRTAEGIDIRQGIERRANGVNALVVWLELTCEKPVTIEISRQMKP